MFTIPGFKIDDKLYESKNTRILRARRVEGDNSVILKVLKGDHPEQEELTDFQNEFEITRKLRGGTAIEALSLEKLNNTLFMVLEDFPGLSLKQILAHRKPGTIEFLELAIALIEALDYIHRQEINHYNINSSNFLWNADQAQVKIIDFGSAAATTDEPPAMPNHGNVEPLAYISPEMTGRLNRKADYRSDYYSLGIVLYESLMGFLPFQAQDAMELVHSHIAKAPISPTQINNSIPPMVSEILLKLLEKSAEDRYQSSTGLKADLEFCLAEYRSFGAISLRKPGQEDRQVRFLLPRKLFGRERELAFMDRLLNRNKQGKSAVLIIEGPSGIGKTALVREFQETTNIPYSFFLAGKFEAQKSQPYLPFVQGIKKLIQELLKEDREEIAGWRKKILRILGTAGQVLVDVIPEIEMIIGAQPPAPKLSPVETENRFYTLLQNFLGVFAEPTHPLIIFMDDLQWADSASLKVINTFMETNSSRFTFLITGIRREHHDDSEHLLPMVQRLREQDVSVRSISLQPLNLETAERFLESTVNRKGPEVTGLAEICLQKTQGNPFFLIQFLESLHREELIHYDENAERWAWNRDSIRKKEVTDNVVNMTADRIRGLSAGTQTILKIASCLGDAFEVSPVRHLTNFPSETLTECLEEALWEGLIFSLYSYRYPERKNESATQEPGRHASSRFKFLHSRVQLAAYSLIPETEKNSIHLQIGRWMLEGRSESEIDETLLEILPHLNGGRPEVIEEQESVAFAKLNMKAAERMKSSAAFEQSYGYLKQALEFLPPDSWYDQYTLTLQLHLSLIELAYLNNDFLQMEKYTNTALKNVRQLLDRTGVFEVQIRAQIAQSKYEDALDTALSVLNTLGFKLRKKPGRSLRLLRDINAEIRDLFQKSDAFLELPEMTDLYAHAAIRIMTEVSSAARKVNPDLYIVLLYESIKLCRRRGNTSMSSFLFAAFGVYLCDRGRLDRGYKYGNIALKLLERYPDHKSRARPLQFVNAYILPWKEHIYSTLPGFLETYHYGIDSGDMEYAAYALIIYITHSFYLGKDLRYLSGEIQEYRNSLIRLNQERIIDHIDIYQQTIENLLSTVEAPYLLEGEFFTEIKRPLQSNPEPDASMLLFFYTNKLYLAYLFGETNLARQYAQKALEFIEDAGSAAVLPFILFYESLSILASAHPTRRDRAKLRKNQKRLKYWARKAPMNYAHKYLTLEGETARLRGKTSLALDYYRQAADLARENFYNQEEALIYELTARYHLEQGRTIEARAFLKQAVFAYLAWGAQSKVEQIYAGYPNIFADRPGDGISLDPEKVSLSGQSLDLSAVFKASQAIAGEIRRDRLLEKLMKTVMENAGAQKAFLLLPTEGELKLEAEGLSESNEILIRESLKIADLDHKLSIQIIQYVSRTHQTVLLDNAAHDSQFANDPYILKFKPLSLLCLPIMHQGRISGILYLENNLSQGSFTPERLEILTLLSSSLAVSLQNVILYQNLEEKVIERTTELREAQEQLVSIGKEATERQMAGGFAHEMRNALAGTRLVLSRVMGSEDPDAVSMFMQNCRKLKELYEYLENRISPEELEETRIKMRYIFQQESELEKITKLVEQATARGLDITRQIMEFSRLGQEQAGQSMIQLDDLIKNTALRFRQELEPDSIELSTDISGELHLPGHRTHFVSILENLVYNGRDALLGQPKAGKQIEIKCVNAGNSYQLEISDNGPGIPEKNLARIYEAFFSTKPSSGAGLGLGVVKKIVSLYHGEIAVQSEEGKGTTFRIQFPIGLSQNLPTEP